MGQRERYKFLLAAIDYGLRDKEHVLEYYSKPISQLQGNFQLSESVFAISNHHSSVGVSSDGIAIKFFFYQIMVSFQYPLCYA